MTAPAEPSSRLEELALALTLTATVIALHGSRLLQMLWQRAFGTSSIFTFTDIIDEELARVTKVAAR